MHVSNYIIILLLSSTIPVTSLNSTSENKIFNTILPPLSKILSDMSKVQPVEDKITEPQMVPARKEAIVNPFVPYSHETMLNDSVKLSQSHPDIITVDSIGRSVEGRDLLLIKLGKGNRKIFLNGSHHAREYISTSLLMKMIDEYSKAYSNNENFEGYDVINLLNEFTIYFVPMVNPDGVNLVLNGINSVKNPQKLRNIQMVNKNSRGWKSNINGVDLNRNYPAVWEKINNGFLRPSSERFKGYSRGSEPETQAIMNLCRNNDFELAMAYHAKGEVIYWADSGTCNIIPKASEIADRLSKITGYKKLPVSQNPSIYGGGFENWFRIEFKRPAFCIELSPYNGDLPHPDSQFDKLVWNKAKSTGLFFLHEAKTLK
ncbi:M14 family metallopeptidase [Pseudobacteroides cellulosolvens]|nr:M14 family metallocarboxypeptidase [Pseudobacteroides cellulosolvens]